MPLTFNEETAKQLRSFAPHACTSIPVLAISASTNIRTEARLERFRSKLAQREQQDTPHPTSPPGQPNVPEHCMRVMAHAEAVTQMHTHNEQPERHSDDPFWLSDAAWNTCGEDAHELPDELWHVTATTAGPERSPQAANPEPQTAELKWRDKMHTEYYQKSRAVSGRKG